MAKIRRIVRKVAETHCDYFDEKVWPVYIALVILGAFLMGVSAAYLRFSGVPWYANAVTSLVGIPLIVIGFMIAFRFIDNRLVRRSMQLAIVASAILHLVMVVHMIETRIFAGLDDEIVAEREVIESRKPKLIPQYHPQQMLPEEDRPKQDFEKPLEVKTPEPQPEPDNLVRQETQPDSTQAPEQPVPVPNPVAVTEPNVVKRNQPNEVAPRAAEQMSKLSRQSKPSEMKISQLVQSLPIDQPRLAGLEARAATARVERQSTEPTATPLAAVEAPTSPTTATSPQLARRSDSRSPIVDATPTPTLKRQMDQPTRTPTSPIAAADAPPQPKATSTEALAPASTFTQKQATASPKLMRSDAPLPEMASAADAPLVRRQASPETAPQVAQSPAPAPNLQPRTTTRPDVAATAATTTPAQASSGASAASQISPQASRIERATTAVTGSQPQATPSAEPTTSQAAVAAARPTRMEGREAPSAVPSTSAAATMTSKTGTPSIAAATDVQPAPTGTVVSSAAKELAAASTATRRQPTTSPQASRSASEPAAAQLAAMNPQATAASTPRRATGTTSEIPTVGPTGPATPSQSRSTTAAVANIVTRAADVPTNAGPQTADSSLPGPSTTAVARQAAGSAAGSANPAAASSSDAGAIAMASGGIARAQVSDVPTMRPQVTAGDAPARAMVASPTATSPTAVDSPATSVASSGAQSTPQPARVAISRAEGGTAGVGNSPNIDRAAPGSESPALIASASARRAETTTQTPGDAFTPSSAAQIARSTAGQQRPAATVRAEATDIGNTPGAADIAQHAASSSATLSRADAQAARAQVSGAKGATDVDIGPTQLVAERGGTRAAGGGQPEPSTELSAAQLARTAPEGGMPQAALAAAQAENVAAPAGESGGVPAAIEAQVSGVAKASTSPAAASGGPQSAEASGAATADTAAQLLARTELSRAQASDGAAGGATAGLADLEDEEERARRLARAAEGGAPQLAVSGPVTAEAARSPQGDGGDAGVVQTPEAIATATTASRMNTSGGAPAGESAGPAGEPGASHEVGGAPAAARIAIARAEAADGAPGTPLAGGGSESPAKASSAPTFTANTTAETIQLAGALQSSGSPSGVSLAARGTQTERISGGASGPVTNEPQGAVAENEALLATAGVAPSRGQRQSAGGAADGPQVADAAATASLAKSGTAAGPPSSATVADIPETGASSAVAQAELDHMMGGMANTPMSRQSGQALAVAVEAPEGPGGLGTEYSPEVGLNSRKAREESLNVQTAAARFVRTAVGGLPAISTTAIVSSEPFVKRSARLAGDQPGSGRGTISPQTNAAIEAGLAFLARHQHPDGHWSLQGFDDATNAVSEDERRFMLVSDTGATALAILAFQGWGYTHREREYKDVLYRGINHLLAHQKENGDLFVPLDDRSNQSVWLYSHALASLALTEAYGMTGDPALKEPAQRAVDFIVASQNKSLGGWRYSPEFDASGAIVGGVSTDTSVTGWMVAALHSARLARLEVPNESFERIEKWMNSAQGAGGESHLYRYNPFAPDTPQQKHGRVPSKTMTAVGLLSRELLGWQHNHPALARGAEFLDANPPAIGTAREPQRDTYYWYYATLALVYLKDRNPDFLPIWEKWEATLHPLLRNSQERQGAWAGSWNPRGAVPDRWGLHAGRLYVTTMNLLSLEANYRYLPLHASVLGEEKK